MHLFTMQLKSGVTMKSENRNRDHLNLRAAVLPICVIEKSQTMFSL